MNDQTPDPAPPAVTPAESAPPSVPEKMSTPSEHNKEAQKDTDLPEKLRERVNQKPQGGKPTDTKAVEQSEMKGGTTIKNTDNSVQYAEVIKNIFLGGGAQSVTVRKVRPAEAEVLKWGRDWEHGVARFSFHEVLCEVRHERATLAEHLQREGLLTVSSVDVDVLRELPSWIVSQGGYTEVSRLAPPLAVEHFQNEVLVLYVEAALADWQARRTGAENKLIIVDISDDTFSRALHAARATLAILEQKLPINRLHVLLLLHPHASPGEVNMSRMHEGLPYAALPDTALWIAYRRGGTWAEAVKAAETLQKQRRAGHWPQDEGDFLLEVKRASMDEAGFNAALGGQVLSENPSRAEALQRLPTVTERAALFIAGFLAQPTISEFDAIIKVVLQQRKLQHTGPTHTPEGVPLDRPDAIGEWEEDDLALLERCGITEVSGENGVRLYQFSDAADRMRAREKVGSKFAADAFSRTMLSGLYFNLPRDRQAFAHKLAQMSVEMAERFPDRFGNGWLRDAVMSIRQACAQHFSQAVGESTVTTLGELFAAVDMAGGMTRDFRRRLEGRLFYLCQAMLSRSASRETVLQFGDRLIAEGAWDQVRKLAEELYPMEPTAALRWLKRCLFEQPIPERLSRESLHDLNEVLRVLVDLAQRSPQDFEAVTEEVFCWLPQPANPGQAPAFNPAKTFLLLMPLHFADAPEGVSDPLLSDFLPATALLWPRLAAWLAHPDLFQLLELFSEPGKADQQVIQVLFSWCRRIPVDCADALVQAFFEKVTPPRRWGPLIKAAGQVLDSLWREQRRLQDAAYRSASLKPSADAAVAFTEKARRWWELMRQLPARQAASLSKP